MDPSFIPAHSQPTSVIALVALLDQDRFVLRAEGRPSLKVFLELDALYGFVKEHIEAAGGTVIKFMGDAVLVVFPSRVAEPGILALRDLREEAARWFREHGIESDLRVRAHVGEVALGKLGGIDQLDVIGDTVNACARLPRGDGFSLSEAALNRLSPANRQIVQRPPEYPAADHSVEY